MGRGINTCGGCRFDQTCCKRQPTTAPVHLAEHGAGRTGCELPYSLQNGLRRPYSGIGRVSSILADATCVDCRRKAGATVVALG